MCSIDKSYASTGCIGYASVASFGSKTRALRATAASVALEPVRSQTRCISCDTQDHIAPIGLQPASPALVYTIVYVEGKPKNSALSSDCASATKKGVHLAVHAQ